MSVLFQDLVDDYRINRRNSIVQLESRLKKHLLPAFGHLRAADFTTHIVKQYRAERLEAGAQPATVNRELEIIKRSFRLGAECDPPKVVRVVHVPMLQEDNIRTGFLDDAAYIRLRQELPDYLLALFVVGYHVGHRLGELVRLKWPQVDFEHGQIALRPALQSATCVLPGSRKTWQWRSLDIEHARSSTATTSSAHGI
jgi:integrase